MSTYPSEQDKNRAEGHPKPWTDGPDDAVGRSLARWKKFLLCTLAFIVLVVLLSIIVYQKQTIDGFAEEQEYEKSQEPGWYKLFPVSGFGEDDSYAEDDAAGDDDSTVDEGVITDWDTPELESLMAAPLGTEDYSDAENEQYLATIQTDLCELYLNADSYGFYEYARVRLGLDSKLPELVAAVSPYCSQGNEYARDFVGFALAAEELERFALPLHPYKTNPNDPNSESTGNEVLYQYLGAARALDNTVLATKTDMQLLNQMHRACEFVDLHDAEGAREYYAALDQESRELGETKDHGAFYISQLNALQCSTTQEAIESFVADFNSAR